MINLMKNSIIKPKFINHYNLIVENCIYLEYYLINQKIDQYY